MAKIISFLMLCCISAVIDAQTVTKQCRGFRKLDTTEVSISDCQKGICKFHRGKSTEIVLKFTPERENSVNKKTDCCANVNANLKILFLVFICTLSGVTSYWQLFYDRLRTTVKSLSTNVEANINNIRLPWIGVDGTSACNNLFTENGEKASCPLKAGERYVYRNKFDVLTIYPRIQTIVHWALRSGKQDLICFEVPVRIV